MGHGVVPAVLAFSVACGAFLAGLLLGLAFEMGTATVVTIAEKEE